MMNRSIRLLACLTMCLLFLSTTSVYGQTVVAMSRFFPETGHSVRGGFLEFFDTHGGTGIFGFPITDEFIEDGITVQYFEKARLEWHPEAPPPAQVQLGRLGYLLHGAIDAPVPNTVPPGAPDARYFPATGHIVSGPFLAFFDRWGGVGLFGNPITEVLVTDQLAVQYFERARMEQPRGSTGVITLGNVGVEWLTRYPFHSYSLPVDTPARYFSKTGQVLRSAFLDFYEKQGGKTVFGEPISPVFTDDRGISVQYFQRARFEFRPELAPGFQVALGNLGTEIRGRVDPPVPNTVTPWDPNKRYFPQTGHIVSNAFLAFFDAHGKEALLGLPITEAFVENGVVVQYFEKVRMEWHPENPPETAVLLGHLGEERYRQVGPARNPPGHWFGKLWRDNVHVAQTIGKAIEDPTELQMAEQYFEGGFMLTWKGANRIYVLYEGGQFQSFPDTWKPSDVDSRNFPVPADKFEPTGRFGKIWWGLGGPGSKLGWATEELREFTGWYVKMEHGFMLRITRPVDQNPQNDKKWIYVLYNNCAWEIYEDSFDESYTVRAVEPTPIPTPQDP